MHLIKVNKPHKQLCPVSGLQSGCRTLWPDDLAAHFCCPVLFLSAQGRLRNSFLSPVLSFQHYYTFIIKVSTVFLPSVLPPHSVSNSYFCYSLVLTKIILISHSLKMKFVYLDTIWMASSLRYYSALLCLTRMHFTFKAGWDQQIEDDKCVLFLLEDLFSSF
jgi:hypothetical protein